MLEVTGFIKDKYPSLPHKKLLSNTTYEDGFYFKVFVDYDDISDRAMAIETSDSIIVNAINKKYDTDFHKSNVYTYLNQIKIKSILKDFTKLMHLVDDEIFSYQFIEANEVYDQKLFLASGCVYGVCIERLLFLLAKRHELVVEIDNTQLGTLIHKLIKNKIVEKTDENRLKIAARFRNQTAHTNSYSLKIDCDILRSCIDYIVVKYFK